MGQAQSTNYTNTVIGTYTKVVQDTNSTALQSSLNQVRINVSGGKGDVNISNVLSKQTIQNDMTASFESVNDSSVLQKVSQGISQQASSLISGLNLGNFSESSNTINTAINASMDVSQTISTACSSIASNQFDIQVNKQEGDVNINDVKIDQAIASTMTCATKSLNKSVASQEIENKIAQTAKSEAKGLSLDIFSGIVAIVIVAMIVFAVVGSKFMTILGVMLPLIAVIVLEVWIYSKQLQPIQKDIQRIQNIMKKNQEILKQPKPIQQVRTFFYTCGLSSIDSYKTCFTSSNTTAPPPKQNIAGCTFQEVPVSITFSNPDQAYSYWVDQPDLNGIDIISKNNGTSFEYHFYKNVSKECIKLMENLTKKNSEYVKIPPLFCVMKDPVASSTYLPTLSADTGSSFVFTWDGFFYYTDNNVWNKLNTTSLFQATSNDNIKISITPLESTTVSIPNTVKGDYFFIDMNKARRSTEQEQDLDKYYYKIYKYNVGDQTRSPDKKITPSTSDFVEVATLDVTDLVKTKNIGPFMANPKVKSLMNYTAIYDPTIDIRSIQNENQQELDKNLKDEKGYKIWMGVVAGVGGLVSLLIGLSSMLNKTKNKSQSSQQGKKLLQSFGKKNN